MFGLASAKELSALDSAVGDLDNDFERLDEGLAELRGRVVELEGIQAQHYEADLKREALTLALQVKASGLYSDYNLLEVAAQLRAHLEGASE